MVGDGSGLGVLVGVTPAADVGAGDAPPDVRRVAVGGRVVGVLLGSRVLVGEAVALAGTGVSVGGAPVAVATTGAGVLLATGCEPASVAVGATVFVADACGWATVALGDGVLLNVGDIVGDGVLVASPARERMVAVGPGVRVAVAGGRVGLGVLVLRPRRVAVGA